jgi:hypothetical protein
MKRWCATVLIAACFAVPCLADGDTHGVVRVVLVVLGNQNFSDVDQHPVFHRDWPATARSSSTLTDADILICQLHRSCIRRLTGSFIGDVPRLFETPTIADQLEPDGR